MMAERVPSYHRVRHIHIIPVFGKRLSLPTKCEEKKTALLCRIFYFQRLSEEIMTGVWAGFMGELCLPGGLLG